MKPNPLTEHASHGIAAILPDAEKQGNKGSNPRLAPTFTPGPWHDYEHSQESFMIVGDRENAVAHICRTGRRKTDEANARLIAASPSLLAALKNLVEIVADEGDLEAEKEIAAARAAIAAAEGAK